MSRYIPYSSGNDDGWRWHQPSTTYPHDTITIHYPPLQIQCPKCKQLIDPYDRFCRHCGEQLFKVCPHCGKEI